LVCATATPPHVTAANSKAKTAMHLSPAFPRVRIALPFPHDRYSRDETIELLMDK
jgi:hypothetical protein